MPSNVNGHALTLLNRFAQADWPDYLKLRKPFEHLVYSGARTGFKLAARRSNNAQPPHALGDSSALFDLSLTEEQKMLVEMLESFAREVLRAEACAADEQATVSTQLLKRMDELGLVHYAVNELHGGLAGERTTLTNALMAEALAKGDLALAASMLMPLSGANCIRRWGAASQQAHWLPQFLRDAEQPAMAIAVNEPKPLFDPLKLTTKAKRKAKHYVLNGEKCMVVSGLDASHIIVAADAAGGPALFIVDAQSQGVQRKAEPAMGLKATRTCRVQLNAVKVPLDARLSAADFNYQHFLNYSDLAWCALAIGTAQAALDYVITYCNERTAFAEPISHRQGVAFMIADMAIEVDAMRLMVWNACSLAERAKPFQRASYLAQLLCAEKAMKIATDAVQLLGGHGFTKDHPVERWYRDIRAIALIKGGLQL
ncbi:acyl-CoA dehydrogenase family protein [Pseudomonas sp. NPDC078700]|uniref:acyl-CoA dehydrogenase family protein n=1 Tax=Pseudomonas sp. NPDC078700 TaxID=3364424 RepID=UPI0037CA1D48